jgi:16S rRNA (guanine(966)-N(2))-methyltransferase RsmD
MRIIGGRFGGRTLSAPAGLATRPLPDRIRQSLFDWLGQDLSGLVLADVCSGSGSFAFEALSRGAARVHAIESGAPAVACLRANARALGDPPGFVIEPAPFEQVLPRLTGLDLVFADPPFPWFSEAPATLGTLLTLAAAALRPEGMLLIRGERGQRLPPEPPTLRRGAERAYGRSWVLALRRV